MKFFQFVFFFLVFGSASVFSQKIIKHNVKSGESIYLIAKKYDVTEKEIFELNPKLKGAILGLKTEVKIPNKKYKVAEKVVEKSTKKNKSQKTEEPIVVKNESLDKHLVVAKETLYSISKKYGITMETLCELNPELKTGTLKIGSKLQIPDTKKPIATAIKATDKEEVREVITETKEADLQENVALVHKVLPKETLYKISRIYNVSVKELQDLNAKIGSDLPVGYDLVIKKGTKPEVNSVLVPVLNTENAVVEVKPLSLENMSKASFLIAKASEYIGTRYRSGGTTKAGFDCSGLMFATFKEIDMTLPRSSHEMARYGVKIEKSQAQKGDLIFFATFGRGRVTHVGMVTENNGDEIKFIHSSTSSGVIISSSKEEYYARTFVQINRVLQE